MCTSLIADVPDEITYQGRLLHNGSPVTSATSIAFRLFQVSSGGIAVWSETHTVTPDNNGIYTQVLGATIPIPDDFDALWLELEVGAGNTLTPRKKLTSSPFVLRVGELPNLKLNDDNTNIFIGSGPDIPGASITTGNHNVAIGEGSLVENTAGRYNVALGSYALQHHDHNGDSYNIGVGFGALAAGGYTRNIGIGAYALSSAQTTAGGAGSNIAIGYMAGSNITTGDNNIIIGNNVDAPSATDNNQLNIGDAIYGNLSNGNVGIGTTDPGARLEVDGDVRSLSAFFTYRKNMGTPTVWTEVFSHGEIEDGVYLVNIVHQGRYGPEHILGLYFWRPDQGGDGFWYEISHDDGQGHSVYNQAQINPANGMLQIRTSGSQAGSNVRVHMLKVGELF